MHAKPLPTVFFQLELPDVLMFERLLSYHTQLSGPHIERGYQAEETLVPILAANSATC